MGEVGEEVGIKGDTKEQRKARAPFTAVMYSWASFLQWIGVESLWGNPYNSRFISEHQEPYLPSWVNIYRILTASIVRFYINQIISFCVCMLIYMCTCACVEYHTSSLVFETESLSHWHGVCQLG